MLSCCSCPVRKLCVAAVFALSVLSVLSAPSLLLARSVCCSCALDTLRARASLCCVRRRCATSSVSCFPLACPRVDVCVCACERCPSVRAAHPSRAACGTPLPTDKSFCERVLPRAAACPTRLPCLSAQTHSRLAFFFILQPLAATLCLSVCVSVGLPPLPPVCTTLPVFRSRARARARLAGAHRLCAAAYFWRRCRNHRKCARVRVRVWAGVLPL